MTKVYLAGSFCEQTVMRARADELETLGVSITHRWMDAEGAEDDEHTESALAEYAEADAKGVRDADIVVACLDMPAYPYRGTWTEVGMGVALGKTVIAWCPAHTTINNAEFSNVNQHNVFLRLNAVQWVQTWGEVRARIELCASR